MSSTSSTSSTLVSISSSSVPSSTIDIEDDDNAPLWKYVTKIVLRGGGGNAKWHCNFGNVEFQGHTLG